MFIKNILYGIIIGIGFIVPGVSGGVIATILGIYDVIIYRINHLFQDFKNNILFVAFVITTVLNATLLRFFCMHSIENYLSWKAVVADTFVVTVIGSFGYLMKPKNRFYYYGFFYGLP